MFSPPSKGRSSRRVVLVVSLLAALGGGPAQALQSVSLAWNQSPDSSVAGYYRYFGSASGQYTNRLDVGNATSANIAGLNEGDTYYFAITAYNTQGLESIPSGELAYTVPVPTNGTPLPPPWQTADIGSGAKAGGASLSNSTCIVSGAGLLSGTNDSFRFLYQALAGDGMITAQLNSVGDTGTNGRIGVMIRESLAANSQYIFMGIAPNGQFQWQRRSSTGGITTSMTDSVPVLPNAWVRVVRTGTTLDGYQSVNGTGWTHVYSCSLVLAANAYIGLAVGSGTADLLNNTTFTVINVTP